MKIIDDMTREDLIDEIAIRRAERRVYDADNCTSSFEEFYELMKYGWKGLEDYTDAELVSAWKEELAREAGVRCEEISEG